MRANPSGIRARVTDHAIRRYAECALGVPVEGDDVMAVSALRERKVPASAICRHLSTIGGLGVANQAQAVIAEGLKLVIADGAVVTVLAKKLRPELTPSGPSTPVQRRQRTCLDAEYLAKPRPCPSTPAPRPAPMPMPMPMPMPAGPASFRSSPRAWTGGKSTAAGATGRASSATPTGNRWEGKLADKIGESPRTLSRWRVGEGKPSTRTMAWAREMALRTAAEVLSAAGEQDPADGVLARHRAIRHRAAEQDKAAFAAAMAARAAASVPRG